MDEPIAAVLRSHDNNGKRVRNQVVRNVELDLKLTAEQVLDE